MPMYVIFDSAAGLYNKPFPMQNNDVALRAAQDLVNDPASECSKHPEDFSMWKIGDYDDTTADFPQHTHELIARFHELPRANPLAQMLQANNTDIPNKKFPTPEAKEA